MSQLNLIVLIISIGVLLSAVIIGLLRYRDMNKELENWKNASVGVEDGSADDFTIVIEGNVSNEDAESMNQQLNKSLSEETHLSVLNKTLMDKAVSKSREKSDD